MASTARHWLKVGNAENKAYWPTDLKEEEKCDTFDSECHRLQMTFAGYEDALTDTYEILKGPPIGEEAPSEEEEEKLWRELPRLWTEVQNARQNAYKCWMNSCGITRYWNDRTQVSEITFVPWGLMLPIGM
jgi:hypothetical protein